MKCQTILEKNDNDDIAEPKVMSSDFLLCFTKVQTSNIFSLLVVCHKESWQIKAGTWECVAYFITFALKWLKLLTGDQNE